MMADIECDLLIVGSGIGGLTAAIAARLSGLKPLLIEKLHQIGGSSALSGGVLWLPNNPLMIREKVHDSREGALTYLANFVSEGDPASSTARREAFVDAVTPLVALIESQGIPLERCDGYSDYYDLLPGGNAAGRSLETTPFDANDLGPWRRRFKPQNFPVPARASESAALSQLGVSWEGRAKAAEVALRAARARLTGKSLLTAGAALQARLLLSALRLGADIRTNAALVDVSVDGGRASGATVDFDGWRREVRARHGVIVTAGGFARNEAMRRQFQREPVAAALSHANAGNTGEAISAMMRLGAATGWMDEAWWVMGCETDGKGSTSQIVPELHKPHLILVDASGRRFVNEAAPYMETGRACYARNSTASAIPAWAVFDARHRKRYPFGFALPGRTPRAWSKGGLIFRDRSLDGLARQCGIDPGGLEATVTRWNAMCRHGRDEDFGKGASAYNRYYGDATRKPNPCMGPITNAPFHAVALSPGDVGTCGGVITDEHARVKRADGSVIEGLYAAGNCAAPLAGPHYIGAGQSIATSAIFAMIAVRHLVS